MIEAFKLGDVVKVRTDVRVFVEYGLNWGSVYTITGFMDEGRRVFLREAPNGAGWLYDCFELAEVNWLEKNIANIADVK